MSPDRVWVYRIGSLGDALVSVPALLHVKRLHPASRMTLLTNTSGPGVVSTWEVLQTLRVFEDTITYRPGSIADTLRIIANSRVQGVTTLYYFAPLRSRFQRLRDWILFRLLAGIRTVIGLNTDIPATDAGESLKAGGRAIKESERLLRLVTRENALPEAMPSDYLPVPASCWEEISPELRRRGWQGNQRLLALAPGSKMQAKRWPAERYAELGNRLLERYSDVFLVVLGNAEESALGQELCRAWGNRCANLAGTASIMHSAAILQHSVLYVGNDTGTMHLAAASGTRCVAIFSARDIPGKWDPFGNGHQVLRAHVPCAGCMRVSCYDLDRECLKRISVKEVETAVSKVLLAN